MVKSIKAIKSCNYTILHLVIHKRLITQLLTSSNKIIMNNGIILLQAKSNLFNDQLHACLFGGAQALELQFNYIQLTRRSLNAT